MSLLSISSLRDVPFEMEKFFTLLKSLTNGYLVIIIEKQIVVPGPSLKPGEALEEILYIVVRYIFAVIPGFRRPDWRCGLE